MIQLKYICGRAVSCEKNPRKHCSEYNYLWEQETNIGADYYSLIVR
jgi:hypothetical protein